METRRTLLAGLAVAAGLGLSSPGLAQQPAGPATATAIFAGGCFWCMEPPFDALPGVISTTSGYTSGHTIDPTYKEVSAGKTGHTEAVKIVYDPAKVSYGKLLQVFWRNHDPLTANAQFCDRGSQYRAGIYYGSEQEKAQAEASKAELETSGRFKSRITTEIVAQTTFYSAEDYHQDYYLNNPIRYKIYRGGCGRDSRLRELWGAEAGGGQS
ncbi:peptide-methionine (S)-S-oxide reductase MsrA [Bosea sp. (in: a-proteobacteria)]|uniref:peptide-methionine (S)-S-oxide reductase MsrA n=1 Tax=Bosea sp. (in: a-proteobacteria) TaxID=1871050 RepID=UPI00273385F6|nr:peptide-methionine (S)-S-oxide reductase MsrA [Bosea sp. (in: a-proteobacteria)]MDP3410672.1 peptide-methionine (S)-S-oxide reductase MsrA [Bosea sp. (in: a-proteobacteria)]